MIKKININSAINSFIICVACVSLIFSFSNFIPISALISGTIIFFPYLFIKNKDKNKLFKIVFLTFIYFIICTVMYNFKSLFSYGFYRRDGNFFITFAPLLILSLINFKYDTVKILDITIIVITIVNAICSVLYIFWGETNQYFFLFYSHNAAGGFITTLICFTLGRYMASKNKLFLLILILNFITLILTGSRGSIIGLVLAVFCFFFIYKNKIKFMDILVFFMCFIGIIAITSTILYIRNDESLKDDGNNYSMPLEFVDTVFDNILNYVGRSHTIINRVFYLWPRALKLFTMSPIVGTGFGSYNDLPYNLNEVIPNILSFNNENNSIYSNSHAHNSYFHILSETGIIGLSVVLYLMYNIRKYIFKIDNLNLKYSLYLCLQTIIFSSFTEHRLFTPSQVLPFVILLGLAIAEKNYQMNSKNTKEDIIIINGRFITQKITGVQRYAIEAIKQIDLMNINKKIILVHPGNVIQKLDLKNIKMKEIKILKGYLWEQITLPLYLFFIPNVKLINLCNIAPICFPGNVVLHDISFKTNSNHLSKKFKKIYNFITNLNIKRYKHIFTVSEFSKKEIIDNYNIKENKITVTYNSAEHINSIEEDRTILQKLGIVGKDFIFSLGSNSPHKNRKFILDCAKNNKNVIFVITGNSNNIFNIDNTDNDNKNVIYTGYLTDNEIITLYANCKAFLFPSVYEGFGIPPLEAITAGCKNIILSDIPVFKEIYKEYVNYVDINSDNIIDINKYENKNNFDELLKKYSWKFIAKQIIDNLE